MQMNGTVLVSTAWMALILSLTSVMAGRAAVPLQSAEQTCQQRLEEELPQTEVELDPGSALPNGTVVIQWQTNMGIRGSCRVAVEDGAIVEFVNPFAVPRGQRPIENVVAFQTEEYTVRIVRLSDQLYMNVYNRRTDRVELNRQLVRAANSDEGTTYINLLGSRRYRASVSADGGYRLVISLGDRLAVYDQVGELLESPASARILTP